jgi:diguanylate cyclase (GGDEF)-like protein/PAS domain S-box-containing protein
MDSVKLSELIINMSLLLTISIIINILFVKYEKRKNLFNILLGAVIGIVGIFLMLNTVTVSSGIVFDTRSILVSVSGLFFGFVPTAVAVVIISFYRIAMGGAGAFTGVLVTVMTAAAGVVWNRLRLKTILDRKWYKNWIEFYLFGVSAHIIMLLCMFSLPPDMIWVILGEISLPILVIYPIGSLLLCIVLYTSFRNVQTNMDLEKSELHFRTMFEQAPIGISITSNRRVSYFNEAYLKITGRSREDIENHGWESYTHPDDLQKDMEKYEDLAAGRIEGYELTKRYVRPDASVVWVNITVAALKLKNQTGNESLCMVQDITDIVEAETNQRESENRYRKLYLEYQKKQRLLISLLNSIPDLIFYKDPDSIYMGCNRAFEKFVGKNETEIVGHSDFDLFNYDTASLFKEMDMVMMRQKDQRKNEEIVTYPDGNKVTLETLKTPFYDPDGNVLGLIGVSRDITERKIWEAQILYLNYHDVLTGLYNRTFFDEEYRRLDTERQLPISVIIGDIDGLKLLNDAFGHAEGDKLLIKISQILKNCCRKEDIIARTGGDEFCLLLPKTDSDTVKMIVDRIKTVCEEYVAGSDKEVYYTSISLGFATKTKTEETLDKIFKDAEEYMYRRKLLKYKSLHSSIISSIKTTLYEKSNETQEHAERLADWSKKLGLAMGLKDDDLISLELVSTLHDIGKISIDRNILNKPGKLDDNEWCEIKKHPEVGYRIAQTVPELRRIAEYILCHHERWDGKGYPQGLAGEGIPLLSRILAVVDSYDAMTQDRPYRKTMTKDEAIAEIMNGAGTQFDPAVAKTFVGYVLKNKL